MTHPEIDAFLTVIRCGSITKAAETLYVTQPALSRRIKTLEKELGYSLIVRQKGIRNIELTDAGRKFIPVAEKWNLLWNESLNIKSLDRNSVLNASSLDSVSTYIMPPVYQTFLQTSPTMNLTIRTLHSFEAYSHVESGSVDLAFISDNMFSKNVETFPAFKESMLFVCAKNSSYPEIVHPSSLDAGKQIKLPWNPEYDMWHEYWFGNIVQPRVFLDKMSLMEHFVSVEDSWAIVPSSAANKMKLNEKIKIHPIEKGPSDRIIYYLLGRNRKTEPTNKFLQELDKYIMGLDGIISLLNPK